MRKVIHGGDIYQYPAEIIDFSSNINPLGIPHSVKKILQGNWEHLLRYPDIDYRALRQNIAAYHLIGEEQVLVGNGAAEIIFLLGNFFRGKKILIPVPAFGEYAEAVKLGGGEVVTLKRDVADFALPLEEIRMLLKQVDGIILCNPNNPTGQILREPELREIVELTYTLGKYLILDEAFIDFVPEPEKSSGLKWLKHHSQLIIIRAYTKYYALPGLRLGYGLGDERVLADLRRYQMPWSVNSLAVEIGKVVLKDREYQQLSREWIGRERNFLQTHLQEMVGLRIFPTEANFFLIKLENGQIARELKQRMIEKGVLIRDASSFVGLDDSYFRVAIKERTDNLRLINALTEALQEYKAE